MTAPLLLFLLWLFTPAVSFADTRLQVLATDPASPATLGHWEQFYLRIGCLSTQPMRVRGDAFLGGTRVTSLSSGAPTCGPATGDALIWFAYTDPARVDQIVITTEDERGQALPLRAELSVDLTWTGQKPAAARQRADWVAQLQREQDRRMKAEMDAYQARLDSSPISWIIAILMPIVPFAPLALPLWLGRRWEPAWQRGSRVFAVVYVVGSAGIIIWVWQTGSNIAPIWFYLFATVATVAWLAIWLAHTITSRRTTDGRTW
ncbi:MAG: hypothetical protein ACREIJ_12805 [Nitrospiraceae bacterium]